MIRISVLRDTTPVQRPSNARSCSAEGTGTHAGWLFDAKRAPGPPTIRVDPMDIVSQALINAIQIGAPLYNAGRVDGCRETYVQAATTILAANVATEAQSRALKRALLEANQDQSADKVRWGVRSLSGRGNSALDRLLSNPHRRSILDPWEPPAGRVDSTSLLRFHYPGRGGSRGVGQLHFKVLGTHQSRSDRVDRRAPQDQDQLPQRDPSVTEWQVADFTESLPPAPKWFSLDDG